MSQPPHHCWTSWGSKLSYHRVYFFDPMCQWILKCIDFVYVVLSFCSGQYVSITWIKMLKQWHKVWRCSQYTIIGFVSESCTFISSRLAFWIFARKFYFFAIDVSDHFYRLPKCFPSAFRHSCNWCPRNSTRCTIVFLAMKGNPGSQRFLEVPRIPRHC